MHECAVFKDCGHPGNITNGDLDISNGTQVGDVVMYTCDSGYKLSGREYRICQNVGNWSGTEPTCQSKTVRAVKAQCIAISHVKKQNKTHHLQNYEINGTIRDE